MKVNQHNSDWNSEIEQELINIVAEGHKLPKATEMLNERFNTNFTYTSVRTKYSRIKHNKSKNDQSKTNDKPIKPFKEGVKINEDDSQYSDQLIELSNEDMKDKDYLLKAHGYDPAEFKLLKADSSRWHHHNKKDGTKTLYASKILVAPVADGINLDRMIEVMKNIPRVAIKPVYERLIDLFLNIILFDMHFGISDYDYYQTTQGKILNLLDKNYKEVLIPIGSDLFHHNDHRSRTASGREIQQVDMTKAWQDAVLFYEPIIKKAIKQSGKVSIVYIKGNHDESLSWAFTKYLEARFPQVNFDTDFRERKAHMLGNNFIGLNHGDKKKEKDISENFATEFPHLWAKATTREVFVGHLHSERVLDKGGMVIRRLPTRNEIDDWHEDMGYTTAHKRFQVYEYSENELETIYHV